MKILTAAVWLVLGSPFIAFFVYEWVNHPHHHPDTGPHGGVIVEWDTSHETLAEAVVDPQSGAVTVYVLDRWAKRPRPLKARSITLTLATKTPSVVELGATPQERDPPGRASRFSSGRAVLEPGDETGFAGTITVTASGQQFTGDFGTNEDRR